MGSQYYDFLSGMATMVKNLQAGVCNASISGTVDLSVLSYIERNEAALKR